jgi:small subunit ribosomal protein S15
MMSVTAQKKQELIKQFALKDGDTGSSEVQCAVLTERINNLTEHFKSNPKDFHSRRGLLILVGRRKSLLEYVKQESQDRYEQLIKKLGIRK